MRRSCALMSSTTSTTSPFPDVGELRDVRNGPSSQICLVLHPGEDLGFRKRPLGLLSSPGGRTSSQALISIAICLPADERNQRPEQAIELRAGVFAGNDKAKVADRKSTRLNSSHLGISY